MHRLGRAGSVFAPSVCRTCTVGDVGDGIDGAVDGRVLLVHNLAEHRQQRCVDQRDPEADDADWKHEDKEVAREGDEEAGDAL